MGRKKNKGRGKDTQDAANSGHPRQPEGEKVINSKNMSGEKMSGQGQVSSPSEGRQTYRPNEYQQRIDEKNKEMGSGKESMQDDDNSVNQSKENGSQSPHKSGKSQSASVSDGARNTGRGQSNRSSQGNNGPQSSGGSDLFDKGSSASQGWNRPMGGSRNSPATHGFGRGRGRGLNTATDLEKRVGERGQRDTNLRQDEADTTMWDNQGKLDILTCPVCMELYDQQQRKPIILKCGHTICSTCVRGLCSRQVVGCPTCRKPTSMIEDLPVNYAVLQMVDHFPSDQVGNNSFKKHQHKTKPSPHHSKCLEQGVQPSHYCSQCEIWVCKDCGNIDHLQKNCSVFCLIPAEQALLLEKQKNQDMIDMTSKNLSDMHAEFTRYENSLKIYHLVMRATHECIGSEEIRIKKILDEVKSKKKNFQATEAYLQEPQDLQGSLAAFRKVQDDCATLKKWESDELGKINRMDSYLATARTLLYQSVQLNSRPGVLDFPGPQICAQLRCQGTIKHSRLTLDGGRIHIHSLEALDEVKGMRSLPLDDMKTLIDKSSALTFLELSWGGNVRGKVYIRMTGDTIRGRQFVALCLGDQGPSFKNTNFHRIWWKGLPGEHIWGGDYDKGDGGGGAGIKVDSCPNVAHTALITSGLVAGRYEEENISSIFRIYTKSAREGKEEAAFGMVEYGIHTIESAIEYKNVKEVTVSDCGIVVEK